MRWVLGIGFSHFRVDVSRLLICLLLERYLQLQRREGLWGNLNRVHIVTHRGLQLDRERWPSWRIYGRHRSVWRIWKRRFTDLETSSVLSSHNIDKTAIRYMWSDILPAKSFDFNVVTFVKGCTFQGSESTIRIRRFANKTESNVFLIAYIVVNPSCSFLRLPSSNNTKTNLDNKKIASPSIVLGCGWMQVCPLIRPRF